MNQIVQYVCKECQDVFGENDIGDVMFCPNCNGALTSEIHENVHFQKKNRGFSGRK